MVEKPYLVVVNGPNLNRLGLRLPDLYGSQTLSDVIQLVRSVADTYRVEVRDIQSNHEGALIDFLQEHGPGAMGIIINPGALGHYGVALRDCLEDIKRPTIEVHITNVHKRETFRHHLVLSAVVTGQIVGLGVDVYRYAAEALCNRMKREEAGGQP
ncbi:MULTISPECIES: type II 3-dehydroquinate dehydratase [unclassified Paenibacillus]|uniref:type II 3-dehydroquinate dehydratase n=1 Tax=unclassified Paenibacillus TaxID=185978 RepID=UPI001915B660|nr:type II 3-dehydroquinate dehydratase [Paenibacillus sp. EPM92]